MIAKPHRRSNVAVLMDGVLKHMAVHEWGDETNPRVVLCVHGLSRNGRDFDVVADALSKDYRVLCPDIPGRGKSDWLASAEQYSIPTYVQFINAMLTQYGVQTYDWIGTSMGGLIGMVMAATPGSAMKRFVINDIGPVLETEALTRIASYVGRAPTFASYPQLYAAARVAITTFGPLTEAQYQHMVSMSCWQRADGQWEFNMDPKVGDAFRAGLVAPAVDMWPLWQAVTQPTLILRGVNSDLLSVATLAKMVETHPNARALTIADTGHAPMIFDAPTVSAVVDFIKGV
jgi:pimeloyl-ACP methyl ester carboxylesterase